MPNDPEENMVAFSYINNLSQSFGSGFVSIITTNYFYYSIHIQLSMKSMSKDMQISYYACNHITGFLSIFLL